MNPDSMPQRKVIAGGVAGALASLATWGLHQFAGIVVPADQALAAYTVLAFAIQYLVPNAKKDLIQ